MEIESVREYCLSLPMAVEDMPFGDDAITFKVCGRIFACLIIDGSNIIDLKCDPDYALDLRDKYIDIEPAWHWNKKYWNQMNVTVLRKDLLIDLIRHSYAEVVKKLTKKTKAEFPEIMSVK